MLRICFAVFTFTALFLSGFSVVSAQIQGPNMVLSLDGECDYAEVPSSSSLNALAAVTMEAWIRVDQESRSGDGVVGKLNSTGTSPVYGIQMSDGNSIRFQIFTVEMGALSPSPTQPLELGIWYHIAGVYSGESSDDSSATSLVVYINGQIQAGMGCSSTNSKDCLTHLDKSEESLMIGRTVFPPLNCVDPEPTSQKVSGYFQGLVDEIRVWSVVRTQAQIQAFMYQRLPLTERVGLMGYWTMDQLHTERVTDRSGNGNHGQLMGDAKIVLNKTISSAAPSARRGTAAITWGKIKNK